MADEDALFDFAPHYRTKLLKEFGFEEEMAELNRGLYIKSGFPLSKKFHRLEWEVYDLSIEEPYFWILDLLKDNFPAVEKLEDSFAAAENSAFFGITQQRLGAQQDKVSQYLATMGKMIKELFQMVRELRIIDERLGYYDAVEKELKKPIGQRKKGDEITLKGLFVDLVQGGGKSAASVYGMARELEFVTLPDLFFDAPPFKDRNELEEHMKTLEKDFNKNVRRVLVRHLNQFMEWKRRTHQEHINRRRFQKQYLKQHYEIINMYLNWIKPYLRHVARLSMKEKNTSSPELISAFEGSMLDIEIMARTEPLRGANGCLLITFNYRTRPELKVVQEGYQRGPVHIGKMVVTFRSYHWTDKEVENYRKLKQKEAVMLLGEVSSSVRKAMESLGEELERYLKEEDETEKKEEEEKKPAKKTLMQSMFGDFYTPKKKKDVSKKSGDKKPQEVNKDDLKKVGGSTDFWAFNTYHLFKKAHRMVSW